MVASIVVCGGGVIGLSAAMMLARDGHRVTVLEQDPAPPPVGADLAWEGWARRGVAQFHQPHQLLPPFRHVLDEELPGMVDRLVEAGCLWVDPMAVLPPTIADRTPRPGDDRFRFVTGRRPVVEAVLSAAADEQERVDVRRGVTVAGLLTGPSATEGVPHVAGVRTDAGDALEADLVVDAGGRRTRLADWLQAIGARTPHMESETGGFVYHTRYFRGPRLPRILAAPISAMGTISLLTIPGDNGTWSVTVWAAAADTALRPLGDVDRFTAVVRACRLHAQWVRGEAVTGVLTMAGVLDRYRRFVVDDLPVATGIAAVGDAWAATNPSAGRGVTVGMLHAQCLRDVVRSDIHDPEGFARAWDSVTETRFAPFYWDQITADRARMAEMDALRAGVEPPTPDPVAAAIEAAVPRDADVFRAAIETATCMARPDEVFARPGLMDKVRALAGAGAQPMRAPGPDRGELLGLLS